MKKNDYLLIDCFRIIAAFLVIAIHTSPLLIFGDTADFIFTRIISRTAVPFFFMTSGFFLIDEYSDSQRLKNFIKRTAIVYFAAIAIYLPVNIYNGYFKKVDLLPNIIKDLIFEGTFYHLWYLAAAITGAFISWLMVNKLGFKTAFFACSALYAIGLFGDSYYGFLQNLPFLKNAYANMFQISEYTRNGVFFAPVFFVLGGIIKSKKINFSFKINLIGLGSSFFLMLYEGLLLHFNKMQRHDSMYIMLVPCMFFLFSCLTHFKGGRNTKLKSAALIIYIIHPLIIIFVRGFSKITRLQALLIDNSLIHYISVCIISSLVVFFIKLLLKHKKPKLFEPDSSTDRAWLNINLENLKHNAKVLQAAMPKKCKLMAVVKADGYGHGGAEISKFLNSTGVFSFAVATVDEGIKLRHAGVKGDILILGYTCPSRARQLLKYDLTQTLIDYEYTLVLNSQGINLKAHLKIDTGMHRLGFSPENYGKIKQVFSARHLKICGIYTHLGSSQSNKQTDIAFTFRQIALFNSLIDSLLSDNINLPAIHIQSSFGLLNYPQLNCDYARIGIALYGAVNCSKTKLHLDLMPVLSLQSKVVSIKKIQKGDSAGYDRKFTALDESLIAVLPVGYADGIPRCLSCGGGSVLIKGIRVPIIGQVCMDQLMVDVTHIPNIKTGDIATIIGRDGQDEITVIEIAENVDSIANELLSRMGTRLKLIF